jgi:TPR repeat protein
MRTFDALACAIVAVAIGTAIPALALDAKAIGPNTPPTEALRYGLSAFKSGDTAAALGALNYAADKGLASARWKLGEMYATGDGVPRDQYKAFQLFSEVANTQADVGPRDPSAPYVSNAFVQLGSYYRTGIVGSPLKANPSLARQYFTYAASYFGDSSAQFYLARMLYLGEGGDRDLVQAARWANLSADKGNGEAKALLISLSLDIARKHLDGVPSPYDVRQAAQWAERASEYGSVEAQALYGKLLFDGDGVSKDHIDGLMYLTIALARSAPDDGAVRDMQAAARLAATPDEWTIAKQRADEWLRKHTLPPAPSALTQ